MLEFVDSFLYFKVTTDSTSVSELEYLLPRGARDNCAKRSIGFVADWCAQAENAVFDGYLVKPRPVVPQILRFSFKSIC